MDAGGICGGGSKWRTGARILSLLAIPPNGLILNTLSRGPRRLSELRRETGALPQSTLRACLRELTEIGAVARCRPSLFPSGREYELTGQAGRELRFVATTVEGWLSNSPRDPLPFGSEAAQAAIEALVDGWSTTMLRSLAAGPATPSQLEAPVRSLDRPSLERRLIAMRDLGLVEMTPDEGDEPCYAVTVWLREGTAPLAAAIRWERHHLPDRTAPIAPLDAETGLLLATPLLRLPPELSGSCRLGVEFGEGDERRLVGVTVEVAQGRVVSWTTDLESSPAAWATGSTSAWLRTAIESDPNRLDLGGDQRLARAFLDGLNKALFGPANRPSPRL